MGGAANITLNTLELGSRVTVSPLAGVPLISKLRPGMVVMPMVTGLSAGKSGTVTGGRLTAVVVLVIGYHHACSRILAKFEQNRITRGHVWFRWFNEVPVILMLAVVVLVVVKPF